MCPLSSVHVSKSANISWLQGNDAQRVATVLQAIVPDVQALEDEDAVVRYYEAISNAADLPIFIQNHTLSRPSGNKSEALD